MPGMPDGQSGSETALAPGTKTRESQNSGFLELLLSVLCRERRHRGEAEVSGSVAKRGRGLRPGSSGSETIKVGIPVFLKSLFPSIGAARLLSAPVLPRAGQGEGGSAFLRMASSHESGKREFSLSPSCRCAVSPRLPLSAGLVAHAAGRSNEVIRPWAVCALASWAPACPPAQGGRSGGVPNPPTPKKSDSALPQTGSSPSSVAAGAGGCTVVFPIAVLTCPIPVYRSDGSRAGRSL